MPIGKLEPFNLNLKQWPAYIRRVNQYILLNDIKTELKVPMLITVVGESTYSLMCDLCSPDLPENKTYDKLVRIVTDHLEPQRSEIAERHVFRLRRQRAGESLMEYLQALKHLAATCNFSSATLEENLRDQFVSGLANDSMRSRIFAERQIKYKEAVELALALEAAEKHAEVSGSTVPVETSGAGGAEAGEGLHYARGGRGPRGRGAGRAWSAGGGAGGSSQAAPRGPPQPACWRCGKAHRADRCRYIHYNCDECNQRGHLKVMCKSVRNSERADSHHNYVSEESDDMFNIQLTAQGNKPFFIKMLIDGKTIECEVDTGSRIAAISEDMYRQLFAHRIIRSDNLILSSYSGSRIQSLGYIEVDVRLGDVMAKSLPLYIIKNGARPLLGREWLRALKINQIELNEISEGNAFVNQLCAEFPEVITNKLGTCKRTIRLQLTDSEPVYVRARPVPLALRARVERELARLEADGSIYRVDYSDYGTPIVPVIKQNGDIRICGDYKITINPKLKSASYPLIQTERDKVLCKIKSYIQHGWPSHTSCDEEKPYFVRKQELAVELGCVIYKYRIVIPAALRKDVLIEIHEGHLGANKMKNLSRSYVYWPSLDRDLEELCRTCEACRMVRDAPPHAPLHPWEFPQHPWQRLHADFAECAGKRFLIIVDAHSKWIEAIQMRSTDARSTIAVFRNIFSRFGLPSQLVTDNGPPFFSQEFKEYCTKNVIKHVTSAPYRPQGNGAAENAVKTVKKAIKRALHEGEDVTTALSRFLFQYRNCEHATTGVSPAVALQGRRLRGRLDALRPDVAAVVRAAQERQLRAAGGTPRDIAVGDAVLARDYSTGGDKWSEGMVVQKTGPVSYKVDMGQGVQWRRHADQLIKNKNRYSLSRTSTAPVTEARMSELGSPGSVGSKVADDTFQDASDGGGDEFGEDESGESSAGAETGAVGAVDPSSPPPPSPGASARALRAYNRARRVNATNK